MRADSKFIEKYKNRVTKIMMRTNPNWNQEDIEKVVMKMIKKQIMNPSVELDNNFTGEHRETTLVSVLDWCLDRRPLIAGNGTFYKNQHEALNPIAAMLDDMAAMRKAAKKEMFKVGEVLGQDSNEYKDLDRQQLIHKINMNSYYGASGAPSSAFYSKWSGPATTLTAQSVISSAEMLFESFLADNYIYLNLTELIEWIECVLKENDDLDDFIVLHSRLELSDRLLGKIMNRKDNDEEILNFYLDSLTDEEITRIYYKNNMLEFIKDHDYIQELFTTVFENVSNYDYVDKKDPNWIKKIPEEFVMDFSNKSSKDWNKFVENEYFMDPNSPPKTILTTLQILSEYLIKYNYVRFMQIDRIYRLRNFKRRVVTVIDTDSNFLSLDTLVVYILDNILRDNMYGRDFAHNEFIVVNTLTYVITNVVADMMEYYGKCSNIPEEYRYYFNMKNEFFNALLIIGNAKKRYISKQVLREGNLLNPPKTDIKGFDFKKATTSEFAEEVFMKLIKNHIINSDHIELMEMIQGLKNFKQMIIDSINAGDRTFLPNGSPKELGAYADPGTNQSVRGALAWNMLFPDNQIEFPSKVSLIKMNIFSEEDIEPLKHTNPEAYQIIIDKIFHDETGIFVVKKWNPGIDYVNPKQKEWWNEIPEKYRAKYKKLGPSAWNEFVDTVSNDESELYDVSKAGKVEQELKGNFKYKYRGLQVLAIPSNASIPKWIQPYIDYTTMVNNIIAPFKPVLEIFGSQFVEEGKNREEANRKTETVTNIIKF